MKVLIDTNVLIDYIMRREPYSNDAEKLILLCKDMKVNGCIAAHSVMNIFYILRKEMSLEEQKKLFLCLSEFIEFVGIDRKKLMNVLHNDEFTDVEDCLQSECAKAVYADYIVTRNVGDFRNSVVPAILPDEFLKKVNV